MSHQRLPDWLKRQASTYPDIIAIQNGSTSLTYGQLYHDVGKLAGALALSGVDTGQRVAILARHGISFAVGMHALMQLDAILVPINYRLTSREIAWQLQNADVHLLLYDEQYAELAHKVADELPVPLSLWNLQTHPTEDTPVYRTHVNLSNTQVIMYTSGTTSHPKGVMLTYENHLWMAMASALQLGLHNNDKWLAPTPLFHMSGLGVLMKSVIYGTTAVLHDTFDPDAVNHTIDNDGITLISVVPVMLQRMLEARGGRPYPRHLRCVLLGGSSAPKPLLEQCARIGLPVAQSYGLTEACSQVTTLSPHEGLRKAGSYGKPLFPTEVAIVKDNELVGPGVEGEIIVRGPTVSPGYFNNPEATAKAFKDGWLYTGDVGYLDEDGYLYTLDRRKDLIVSGGENVYPAEVEAVLLTHPAVADAGVVGFEDPTWGQAPVAFIKLRLAAEVTTEELQAFCRDRLAGYKVPKRIFWVDSLPRNASGKLMRGKLRAIVPQGVEK